MSNRDLAFWTQKVESQIDLTPCSGCDSCGIRCTAGVAMSQSEYEAVQDIIARSPESEYIERVSRQDKRLDIGDGVVVEMCRFRDMDLGRCAIYPARPLICRLMGHVEWLPCPIEKIKRLPSTRDAIALMQSYSECKRIPVETWFATRLM